MGGQIVGTFKNDLVYDEAMILASNYRKSKNMFYLFSINDQVIGEFQSMDLGWEVVRERNYNPDLVNVEFIQLNTNINNEEHSY